MAEKPVGRPKKAGRYVNCYVKEDIANDLDNFCEETGLTKTVTIEHAIQLYLDTYRQTGKI
jgi:hypothetical protein